MNDFINVWKEGENVFLSTKEIARISFSKDEKLAQSERQVKVQFKDGSIGNYTGHRNLEKAFAAETVKE